MSREFIPTDEQKAVLEWMLHGTGNAVIDAKAGSGKSTLIEHCIRRLLERNPDEKIIYFAFNKNIVEEMRERLSGNYKNLKITTCHSFGLSVINENGRGSGIKSPNDYKYISRFETNIEEYSPIDFVDMDPNHQRRYVANIKKLLDYARYNKDQKPSEVKRTARRYGLELESNEAEVVVRLLRWGSGETESIDFTDMIWLPCENNLSTRKVYNFVFVDEAQDLSPIEQELVLKCIDLRRGRLITVGDRDQAINAWCGADRDAFSNYKKRRNTREFTLSVCHRCSKSVIGLAKTIVPGINAREDAIDGSVNGDVPLNSPRDGDMVVCRYVLPLITYYNMLMKEGKKAYILGRAGVDRIIDEINLPESDDVDKKMENGGIIPSLYIHLFEMIDREAEENDIPRDDVLKRSKSIMDEYDIIKTIEALSSSDMKRSELIEKINGIFSTNDESGIKLTTIHKAKGDEADNVYVLCNSLLHGPMITEEWEQVQEKNLEYVMITRARETLNYMTEKWFDFGHTLSNFTKINGELEEIRKKLGK